MKIGIDEIEVMSPAGSFESLAAAIGAGAGSVYFGAGRLNMRARSSNNFTIEDLRKIAATCIGNGVKSYLTVNTVIYDHEVDEMKEVVLAAKESGVSAIIASDMSVINFARENDVEVHISTQLNVSNFEAVKFYSKFADVIVLARELSLDKVKFITEKIREENIIGPYGNQVKIEVFVHGALCMAVSGKCYMSLHENNHSANRGECLQTCRKPYIVTEKNSGNQLEIDNEYIMSPKDLNTIKFLDKVIESGARVLKIEGRGRSPEYVYKVTKCYKKAAKAIADGTFSIEFASGLEEELAKVFNRGFWDGYYLGRRLGEWSDKHGSKSAERKIYLGKVRKFYSNLGVAVVRMESHDLRLGDKIIFIGPTSGVVESVANEIRIDDNSVQYSQKGDLISLSLTNKVRPSDKLYKLVGADDLTEQR